jgi:hypothetical protein
MKRKKILIVLTILAILGLIGWGFYNYIKTGNELLEKGDQVNTNWEVPEKVSGFALAPKTYGKEDLINFIGRVTKIGNAVYWSGTYEELKREPASGADLILQLAQPMDFTPVVVVDMPKAGENEQYISDILDFVSIYKPPYLGLGNEINIAKAERDMSAKEFLEVFNKAYDQIKEVSPDTQVFTVIGYEKIKQYGVDENESDWEILRQYSKGDMAVFSTYPFMLYDNPEDMPGDYYSSIKKYTDKPIGFAQVGWPSTIVGDADEQRRFVEKFFELSKDVNPKFSIWTFLYDQNMGNIPEPFNTLGFVDTNDDLKPGLEVWTNLSLPKR